MAPSPSVAAMAGLLHDIGKLYQRAYGNKPPPDYREEGFTHQDYTAYFAQKFIADDKLSESAKRHHAGANTPERLRPRKDQPLDWVVFFADNYASRERSGEDAAPSQPVERTPLISIFSQVRIQGQRAPEQAYPFLPGGRAGLSPGLPYPTRPAKANATPEAYERLVEHLEARASKAAASWGTDPHLHLANLNMAFLETLWSVPADTRGDPGISLYDHLRLTAAFAAALYAYHQAGELTVAAIRDESAEKFLLVGGDMSGIQSHIYRIKDAQGQGSIAKRLRARSLEVSLSAEAMALGLTDRLGLPPLQRIMSAGGKFYALLPNTEEARRALDAHRETWEAWALEQGASLVPVLDSVPFSPEALKAEGFAAIFQRLIERMAEAKLRPLHSQRTRFAAPFGARGGQSRRPCAVCGIRPAGTDEPGASCLECERDRAIGARLPRARWLSANRSPEPPYYRFPELAFDTSERGYVLRGEADFSPAPYPWELRPLLGHLPTVREALAFLNLNGDLEGYRAWLEEHGVGLEDDAPLSEDKPLTFSELAHLSGGAPYLGALMLDADRMGEAFARGFEHMKEPMSPGRIATLSRAIETFFTLEVGGLIQNAAEYSEHLGFAGLEAETKTRRYRLIYTVYSGGDDLFLIGPWDVLLDFALDLNTLYGRYTAHPALTLSGGFALFRPTTPVPMIYEAVHRAEEQAKARGKDPESPTRGQGHLSLFGQAVPWDALRALAPWARWLGEEVASRRFPSALAYRLLKLHRHFGEEKDQARKMFYKPQLAYVLRNYADEEKFPGYYERLHTLLDHTRPEWAHLPVWVEWGLYGARGRKG